MTQSGDRGKQTESPSEAESHSLPRPSISRTPRPTSTMGAFTTHVPSYTPFAFDASRLLGRRIQPHAPRLRLRPPGSPRRRLTRISNKIHPPIIADKYAAPPDPKEEMYVPMKVVVVGDGAVGKTSMLLCYTTNTFPTDYMATVFDNYAVNVPYGNQVVSLGLWDTAGQEEYARYRPLSYDKADGFILAFDLTSRKSMENVHRRWIKELRAQAPGAPVVLVGTKLDLRASGDADGCVTTKEGEAVGKKIGAERYVECSALTQDNLGAVFDSAVDVCMKRRAALRDKGERNQGAQASGCCSIS